MEEMRHKNLTFVTIESNDIHKIIKDFNLDVDIKDSKIVRFKNELSADLLIKKLTKYQIDRILIEDTKIDSPYNTYKYAGLPPGAISNPGVVALNAAANAPKTNYYFFQIADAQTGRHVFTKTFEEHIENHNLVSKKAAK